MQSGSGSIQTESSSRTVFTDFRNPLSRETFKRPQDRDSLYYSSTSTDNYSKKRSRSPSPPSYDRMRPVSSTNISSVPSVISVSSVSSSSKSTLSLDELNKLKAKALRARLMNMPNADDLEKQFEEAKKKAEACSEDSEVCWFIPVFFKITFMYLRKILIYEILVTCRSIAYVG